MVQRLKHLPAMWETWVRSLGWENPLEEGMAIPKDREAWQATVYSPWGCKELDTTE